MFVGAFRVDVLALTADGSPLNGEVVYTVDAPVAAALQGLRVTSPVRFESPGQWRAITFQGSYDDGVDRNLHGGQWASSDANVATAIESNGEAIVTALGVGAANI